MGAGASSRRMGHWHEAMSLEDFFYIRGRGGRGGGGGGFGFRVYGLGVRV